MQFSSGGCGLKRSLIIVSDSNLKVVVDDRVRLGTAVLAASDWPKYEQRQLAHAVHPHAKQTRQWVSGGDLHPAALMVNQSLQLGWPIDLMFWALLRLEPVALTPLEPLPSAWDDAIWRDYLQDFRQNKQVVDFFARHDDVWQAARNDLEQIFAGSPLLSFLAQITDLPLDRHVTIMPNLVYPALTAVFAPTTPAYYLLLPPPKAVGESPPWPYREDPSWVHVQTCRCLLAYMLEDTFKVLDPSQQALLSHAATTVYLEQAMGGGEAAAYLARSKKQHNLPGLPSAIETLRDYLDAPSEHNLTELFL
jgi:hypothetical protein